MRCESVGKGRRRCGAETGAFSSTNNSMELLPCCVDCGRNLCETHLARHYCGDMKRAGAKRGDAPARYEEEMGE